MSVRIQFTATNLADGYVKFTITEDSPGTREYGITMPAKSRKTNFQYASTGIVPPFKHWTLNVENDDLGYLGVAHGSIPHDEPLPKIVELIVDADWNAHIKVRN